MVKTENHTTNSGVELPDVPQEFIDVISHYDPKKPNVNGHSHGEFVEYHGHTYYVIDSFIYMSPFLLQIFINSVLEEDEKKLFRILIDLDTVNFDSLENFLEVRKWDDEYTFEVFVKEEYAYMIDRDTTKKSSLLIPMECLKEKFDSVQPLGPKKILSKYKDNAEKRMVAFKFMPPEIMFEELDAEKLDTKFVEKKHMKTFSKSGHDYNSLKNGKVSVDDFYDEEVSRSEEYTLYRIPTDFMFEDMSKEDKDRYLSRFEKPEEYMFMIKCVCPSTDKKFYLYVNGENCKDKEGNYNAITAIASTMIFDGEAISEEQYLKNLEEEA